MESLDNNLIAIGYASITSGAASAFSLPSVPERARAAFVSVENQAARYRLDGADPTDVEGHLLAVGEALKLDPNELRSIRFRSTSTLNDTTLRVTYFG